MNAFLFDWKNVILSAEICVYLFFAFLIYLKGKDENIKKSYLFAIASIIFWIFWMILYRSSSDHEQLLFNGIALYVFATFTASSFCIFSFILPKGELPSKRKFLIITLINLAVIISVLTPGIIIQDVKMNLKGENPLIWGKGYIIYVVYIVGFFSLGLWNLFKEYQSAVGEKRLQLLYVFWGYLLGASPAIITNLVMVWWGDFRLNWLGQVLSLFMVAFAVYAIIRHRLMDIRFFIRKWLVVLLTFSLIIFSILVIRHFIRPIIPSHAITDIFLVIFSLAVFLPVRNLFFYLSNKFLFSSLYDPGVLIQELDSKLWGSFTKQSAGSVLFESLGEIFHLEKMALLAKTEKSTATILFNQGFDKRKLENFFTLKIKDDHAKSNSEEIVLVEEFISRHPRGEKFKEAAEVFTALEVAAIVPLCARKGLVGVLLLGAKGSQDVYNEDDLKVLLEVGRNLALIIGISRQYEQQKRQIEEMQELLSERGGARSV